MLVKNVWARWAIITVIAGLAAFMIACADPYTESMRTSAKFSDTVTEGTKLVGDLYDQGLISKPEKNDIAGYLIDATHLNQKFRDSVNKIHDANAQAGKADYVAAADTIFAQVGDPTTLQIFDVKNPAAQQRVRVYAQSFKTALDAISLAISKAKGK